MSATDDYLEALYKEGIRIRDEWFATYVANLNVLGRTLGSSQQFITDLGHLVPPVQPLTGMAPPAMDDMATRAEQEFPATPPPLPRGYDIPPPNIGDSDEEYEARLREVRERAIGNRPGLDGVMGGRR